MKKVLIVLGLLIAIGVSMFLIPATIETEQSVVINKNMKSLNKYMSNYNRFTDWSPWSELDPACVVTVEGTPNTVGHKYTWASDSADVGTGYQTIDAISANQIDQTITFTAPWESTADVWYKLETVEGGTKVSWGFKQEGALVMTFMGIDEMVGESYKKGLAKLKTIAESKLILNAPKM